MHYRVERYLPTRDKDTEKKGAVGFDDKTKKFLISPVWHVDEKTNNWVIDSKDNEQISLPSFEHLLMGIGILNHASTASNSSAVDAQDFKNDITHALEFIINAQENETGLAHFYMAEMLKYFEGDKASKEIHEHYTKANAFLTPEHTILLFNKFLPLTYGHNSTKP
jgi:hypothetical protein